MINQLFDTKSSKLLDKNIEKSYFLFPTQNNPKLFINKKSNLIANGMNMYNPYSIKGKIIKKTVSINNYYILKKMPFNSIESSEHSEIYKKIENICKRVFNEDKIFFNIYVGTPGINQKLTLQINNRKAKILGYLKLGNSPNSRKMINQESKALNIIKNKFDTIKTPVLLGQGDLNNFSYIIQSTQEKTVNKKPVKLTRAHINFLSQAHSINNQIVPVNNFLDDKIKKINCLRKKNNPSYIQLFDTAVIYLKNNIELITTTYIHGDFAPWNTTFIDQDNLYVFDWEYFNENGPIYYDLIHYLYQLEILIYKNDWKKVIVNIMENKLLKEYSKIIEEDKIKFYFIIYLLESSINLIYENKITNFNITKFNYINSRLKILKELTS